MVLSLPAGDLHVSAVRMNDELLLCSQRLLGTVEWELLESKYLGFGICIR